MTRLLPFLVVTALVLAFAVPAPAAGPVTVTTEAEFQQALDGGATTIRLPKDGTIELSTGLTYNGDAALTILGRGATLDADGLAADAFFCDGGDPEDDQDPLRVDERGDGDILATFRGVVSIYNVYDGIELDETDDGDLVARFSGCTFENNADDGIDLEQAGAGTGTARVTGCTFHGNGGDDVAADGVDISGNY